MTTVKALIKNPLTSQRLSYRPCAVIMGKTGAGKTTLTNALCGTQHTACEGSGSITRNLFRNDVSCGDHSFSLIDTPGTDSPAETYKHAILLREALTATKINTIFIVIKFDGRFNNMIDNFFGVESPVHNYKEKVVLIISHWDISEEPTRCFQQICKLFEEECPQVTNVIFCSKQSSTEEVANLMYRCISNMRQTQLEISDEDFHLNFNIYEIRSQMKRSFEQYQKKANSLAEEYTELVGSVQSQSIKDRDKDEVLHMTIVKFKDEMETLLEEFRQEHGNAMQELDYYVFYIKMQKEIVRMCDEFVERVVPLMSYNLFDNQDPRNLIKRCPRCEEIWFKTEGCDGTTTCGENNFEEASENSKTSFWKYQITRVNGKLQWIKDKVRKSHHERSEEPRRKGKSEPVGCGKKFDWSKLPQLEDELILELFKVKTIDEAKQLIKAGHFTEVRQNYASNIDVTFYQ
jgi:predicted GTPase